MLTKNADMKNLEQLSCSTLKSLLLSKKISFKEFYESGYFESSEYPIMQPYKDKEIFKAAINSLCDDLDKNKMIDLSPMQYLENGYNIMISLSFFFNNGRSNEKKDIKENRSGLVDASQSLLIHKDSKTLFKLFLCLDSSNIKTRDILIKNMIKQIKLIIKEKQDMNRKECFDILKDFGSDKNLRLKHVVYRICKE